MKAFSTPIIVAGLLLAMTSSVRSGDLPSKNADLKKPEIKVITVIIHPAVASKPALKYHLLPTTLEKTPGNAATLYLRAVNLLPRDEHKSPEGNHPIDQVVKWLEMPLDKLPLKEVQAILDGNYSNALREVEYAAKRERCDWDLPIRECGSEVFSMLLPELSDLRSLARVVALRARLQIAEKKYADAVDSLKVGYSLARHLSEQPTVVSGLVGLAVARLMNDQLLTLCQQPDAPNLYWSIAILPNPIVDLQTAIEYEYDIVHRAIPQIDAVRRVQNTPEQCDRMLQDVATQLKVFDEGTTKASKIAKWDSPQVQAAIPIARKNLIAIGYSDKDLDAMPPTKIVLLHMAEMYDVARDDLFKWMQLPYYQAQAGLETYERDLKANQENGDLNPLAHLFLPSLGMVSFRVAEMERQVASLRCIEAMRLYAVTHKGKLPSSLDEIKEVPIPLNPVTGKMFSYRLDGETAILEADGGPQNQPHTLYRVMLAK